MSLDNEATIWEAFHCALQDLRRSITLRPFPETGICAECAGDDFVYNDFGYVATYCCVIRPEGRLLVKTGGFDDYTSEGEFQMVTCGTCGAVYNEPESRGKVDWC